MKTFYKILVEGGQHDIVDSLAKARRIQRRFEAEGWNVRVIEYTETILGVLGVDK